MNRLFHLSHFFNYKRSAAARPGKFNQCLRPLVASELGDSTCKDSVTDIHTCKDSVTDVHTYTQTQTRQHTNAYAHDCAQTCARPFSSPK